MAEEIFIKSHYGKWQPVDVEKAINYCIWLMRGMTCPDSEKKRYIEKNHLKGITLDELIQGGKNVYNE